MKKYILTIALILIKVIAVAGETNSNNYGEKRSNFAIMAQMECAANAIVVEDFQLKGIEVSRYVHTISHLICCEFNVISFCTIF